MGNFGGLLRLSGKRRDEREDQAGKDASSSHEAPFPSVLSAASSRARTSRSRAARTSSRRRRLSTARHFAEHARLPLRSTMGAPHASQVACGEATTGARTVLGETWAPVRA